jgi:ABC-type Zn uptake system ZnuABC Zn-binding protein ZnuA
MTEQRTQEWLDSASPAEIRRALRAGELEALIAGDADPHGIEEAKAEVMKARQAQAAVEAGGDGDIWDQDRLDAASADEVLKAQREGKLDGLI